jgi:cell division protein FtsQ
LSIGAAVVLGAGWWVSHSPAFDLRSILVRGNAHLTAAQVRNLSGLNSDTNVLWLRTGLVERRLEANPWVFRAEVARRLPSGITITVEERAPVAVTRGRHGMLLAGDGMVLGPAASDVNLPVVKATGSLLPGDRVASSGALIVVRAIPPELLPMVARVGPGSEGSLVVALRDGVAVVYGDATRAQEKSAALRAVLSWAIRHGVRLASVDVRAPTAPFVRQQRPLAAPANIVKARSGT